MRRLAAPDRRDEAGMVVAEFTVVVGMILFPVMILVLSFPVWVERQSMARVAAQEAARTVALADDTDAGVAAAEQLVAEIATNHGVDPSAMTVTFTGSASRGSNVTATVDVDFPPLSLPLLGGVGSVHWSTSHTERVDDYRGFRP